MAPLAALLLCLAGLLPQGWMPRAAAGGMEIAICTAAGAIPAVVDFGGDGEEAPGKAAAHGVCAFAASGPAGPPPAAGAAIPAARDLPRAMPVTGPPAPIRAAPALRLPPSHAPPASA